MQWLKDCRVRLVEDYILGYNPNAKTTASISQDAIPEKNHYLGQVEILSLLTNLEYDFIRNFYSINKENNGESRELDTNE